MGRQNKNHKISVVIPLFREPNAAANIKTVEETLKKSFSDYEIVCVEDGTEDLKSTSLKGYKSKRIKILSYPLNVGKGFALSYGFTQSSGDIVAFLDGDLDIHPKHLRLFADLMDLVNADIVIGSKRHPLSKVNYPTVRRIYSRTFQILVRIFFGLNVTDTQVGIKLFKRKVLRKVIPRLVVKAWAFDLEVLVVAHHLGFRKIIEAPVNLRMRALGSKIDFSAVRNILQDTAAIFYRRYLLRFYDRQISPEKGKRRRKRSKKSSTRK